MGTIYYLVDEPGKRVLEIGKAYWLHPEDWSAVTASDIAAAVAEGEGAYPHPDYAAAIAGWLAGSSGPVALKSENSYESACEPWLEPDDERPNLAAWPETTRPGWTSSRFGAGPDGKWCTIVPA